MQEDSQRNLSEDAKVADGARGSLFSYGSMDEGPDLELDSDDGIFERRESDWFDWLESDQIQGLFLFQQPFE